MSTVKTKKVQLGTDATATNNFTIYQPATPDGTLRIGVGNADSPTEVGRFNSNGYVATNAPAFSAYQSSAQTLSSSTNTKIQYQTERFDTNSNYDNTTNYRFTPTVAGYYQVNASLGVGASPTGVYTQIFKNGSLYEGSYDAGHTTLTSTVSSLVYLNGSTDYIEIYGNFGTGQVTAALSSQTWFNAVLVRAA